MSRTRVLMILQIVFAVLLLISVILMKRASMLRLATGSGLPLILNGTAFWAGLIGTVTVAVLRIKKKADKDKTTSHGRKR
ncbi:MAG: hypothetical protein IJ806_10040 [Ruminococcus sp.]|nr:hypothetical protein [Ruminococcus sp.]